MFIIIVTETDKNCLRYNCVLENRLYFTRELAEKIIEETKEEDAKNGWQYDYTIVEVNFK